nr:uncharacterized protein LOC117683821 [Crassostrea gigas]
MASIDHMLVLCLAVLMVTQSYGFLSTNANHYAYMTNHPESVDHYVYLHFEIGSEARSTNYETRYNGEVCYNVTNFVLESMGSMGNHRWLEITFAEDCVLGRVINEHIMTEEEPFSVYNVYWYNKLSHDSENPPTCTPNMYHYHAIFTLSKDPDKNVKEMVEKYVEDNNIKGLHRQGTFECDV